MKQTRQEQMDVIKDLSMEIFENAKAHGFWEDRLSEQATSPIVERGLRAECLMLMITELTEAFEDIRNSKKQSDKIPSFTPMEEELADCVIRILDYAGGYGLALGPAIIAKMRYNKTRPYKHGKEF